MLPFHPCILCILFSILVTIYSTTGDRIKAHVYIITPRGWSYRLSAGSHSMLLPRARVAQASACSRARGHLQGNTFMGRSLRVMGGLHPGNINMDIRIWFIYYMVNCIRMYLIPESCL